MPTDQELSKLSDEHKQMLAEKCVHLLMRGKESTEVWSKDTIGTTPSMSKPGLMGNNVKYTIFAES